MIQSINPATSEVVERYEAAGPGQLSEAAQKLHHGWKTQWRSTDPPYRAGLLKRLATLLQSERDQLARLITLEMGKPIAQSLSEIDKCAWVCDYYAEHWSGLLAERDIATEASVSKVVYRPLGVVLAVMPWNFPFWQVFRFLAPNLMAGNGALIKHASNVTGCALAIRDLAWKAGVPTDVLDIAVTGNENIGGLIAQPEIAAVTLTGSNRAGKEVAAAAGRHLKKCVLELGGSDAYVVLDDADLYLAAEKCSISRMLNNGQSCIAAKRFIVVDQVYDEFLLQFSELMGQYIMGDPSQPATKLGPMARTDLRDELHRQVDKSLAAGAQLVLGGFIPDGNGSFYPATILSEVKPGMPAFDEELFGPVAAVIRAKDEEEAVRLANASVYGLGSAVFTKDPARAHRIAENELEAGCAFINDFVRSDPRLPFGGIKESGYGRELSVEGIREFMNVKTVYAP